MEENEENFTALTIKKVLKSKFKENRCFIHNAWCAVQLGEQVQGTN